MATTSPITDGAVASASVAAPRRRLPLIIVLLANAISYTGSTLTLVAIPWFVLQTTGSPAQAGITAAFEALASVVAAFLGGALADRVGYVRISVLADLLSAAAIAAIPTLYVTVGLAFWQLVALVFLAAFFNMPGGTARTALVPDLAARAHVPLERANSYTQAIERGSRLTGGPLAAALFAVMPVSAVLWADAGSFLASAALIGLLVGPVVRGWATHAAHDESAAAPIVPPVPVDAPAEATPVAAAPRTSYASDLFAGIRFLAKEPLARLLILIVLLTNFLDAPFIPVLMQVYTFTVLHDLRPLALAIAGFGGGSLAGALLYAAVGPRLPRRPVFILAFIVVGLRFWVLAPLPGAVVLVATLAITGFASGPLNPILGTVAQEVVPPAMRGRVFGVMQAGSWAAMPLGLFLGGVAVQAIGLQTVLIVEGAAYLLVTTSLLASRTLRRMDALRGAVAAG